MKQNILYVGLLIAVCCNSYTYQSDNLDVMVDFAYPISIGASIRYDFGQSLFHLQQHDIQGARSYLEMAVSKLQSRKIIDQDDRDFIQEMIDRINELIEELEEQDKSAFMQLSENVHEKL